MEEHKELQNDKQLLDAHARLEELHDQAKAAIAEHSAVLKAAATNLPAPGHRSAAGTLWGKPMRRTKS